MTIRITVTPRLGEPTALTLARKARQHGFPVEEIARSSITLFDDPLNDEEIEKIAREILTNPVTETFRIGPPESSSDWVSCHIFPLPGVTNPAEDTLIKALQDFGLSPQSRPRLGSEFKIKGLSAAEASEFAKAHLYNPVVEGCEINLQEDSPLTIPPVSPFELIHVPLRNLDEKALMDLSRTGLLALDLDEMKTIQNHYQELGREPTDIELETLAQTWSEHCCHKTLTATVKAGDRVVKNILKSTIKASTDQLNKNWCLSVFKDNAGVIAFDEDDGISFKVETHNHPSAIEPYGGAGTGLGGCIRDTLGTGCGARPIANTDVFCFAPLTTAADELPPGVLPPQQLFESVVAGVRDYGNRMGIPTVNGAICFDPDYVGNPLVYCGSVGIIPQKYVNKQIDPGDVIVAIGGRTGRDGIHGATFSSIELDEASQEHSGGAVQIGNPIVEKMCLDVLLKARDLDLIKAITDCGAGGFSSAIGEMGEDIGAAVHLEKAPLKYTGLKYWEVWISEAQERMVLAIDPQNLSKFFELCKKENVEATELGVFGTDNRDLILNWEGEEVGRLSMDFLHNGRPEKTLVADVKEFRPKKGGAPQGEAQDLLLKILSSPNVASKEWVIRQYDHEVQAGSIVKPLIGVANDGPSDAAVIAPKFDSYKGVILSNGINPHYGKIDPYWMTAAAIDEALRGIISVGGDLSRCALLDNFSWGNTSTPEGLGSLLRSAEACHDAALAYGTPFVSGKDSLNNEFKTSDRKIVIPDTILISAYAVMKDFRRALTSDLKEANNLIYILGQTKWELGGSHLNLACGHHQDTTVPQTIFAGNLAIFQTLAQATEQGLVRSVHDLSEGGLAVAAAEMAFAGDIGIRLNLDNTPTDEPLPELVTLFSESTGRFLVEVAPTNQSAFEKIIDSIPSQLIGHTTEDKKMLVTKDTGSLIDVDLKTLKDAWQTPLNLDNLS